MKWQQKRIALVKQYVYQDLYCSEPQSNFRDIILSSVQRCGPVGLINECRADFYIVNVDSAPECSIWKEKSTYCGQRPVSYYEEFGRKAQSEIPYAFGKSQKDLAININDIDWSKYDIVISLDVSFPTKFITKFANTLWCYMPGEPCMDIYRRSRKKVLSNYHLFLNQEIRHYPFTSRPVYFPHYKRGRKAVRYFPVFTKKWRPKLFTELDFPYSLVSSSSIKNLFEGNNDERKGIAFEYYTYKEFSLQKIDLPMPINFDSMERYPFLRLPSLAKTKYFISDSRNYTRGNGILEAMSAGCLCLSTKNQFVVNYQKLLGRRGMFKNMKEIIHFMENLERNPDLYEEQIEEQNSIVDYFCFEEPLKRLFECHDLLLSTI